MEATGNGNQVRAGKGLCDMFWSRFHRPEGRSGARFYQALLSRGNLFIPPRIRNQGCFLKGRTLG